MKKPTRIGITLPGLPLNRFQVADALEDAAATLRAFGRSSRIMSGPIRTAPRATFILADCAPDPRLPRLDECGASDGGHGACIHPAGHVQAGQPIHSDGQRTWRDKKAKAKKMRKPTKRAKPSAGSECPTCIGTGSIRDDAGDPRKCLDCNGSGVEP